jgi:hypothetical protein
MYEVRGHLKNLHDEKCRGLHRFCSIVRAVKCRGYEEMKKYSILVTTNFGMRSV